MERNAALRFRDRDFEITWLTESCQHILENHAKPTHMVDFRMINQILKKPEGIEKDKKPNTYKVHGVAMHPTAKALREYVVIIRLKDGSLDRKAFVLSAYLQKIPK